MRDPSHTRIPALALALASVALPVLAQPRAVIEEPVVDVGRVVRGDDVEHTFRIANEGDKILEITEVSPTCGCTVVDYSKQIAAGAKGKVVATLSTKALRGPIAKTIRVFTNDARNPEIDLVIKADVQAYVEAEPGWARFLAVFGQGAEAVRQIVYSDDGGELVVKQATSPYPFVAVALHEAGEDERVSKHSGRQWVLEMSLKADAPVGSFADFVTLDLDHSHLKRLRIPVSGFVQPVVAVLPRVVDFGRKDVSKPQTTILEIKNLGKPAVTLGTPTTTVRGLKPEVEVIDAGRLYRVRLTLDPGMPKGDFRGTLTIPTSSKLQPQVEVDVRGTAI
jgi:Protein of unknown function (DUF1573)